jgi:hypothetical protein
MNDEPKAAPSTELARILDSAKRLGVELDEEEALQWLTSMAACEGDQEIGVDTVSNVYGHKVTLLDFGPKQLEHYRQIGRLVEFDDVPGVVETALSISGSAAQGKIQSFPGDCDYFERVNILAPTREEACQILSRIMREKALATLKGDTYQLIEVKFGSFPFDLVQGAHTLKAGSAIAWSAEQIRAGQVEGFRTDGVPAVVRWDDVSGDPGWCKLDWVVADPVRGELANASNMLDVTWEAPDGNITPLDGYLDPYFQEVYLDASSVPIFSKLAKHVSANALDGYVEQLEKEVKKYLTKDLNYGKVAKRMYNIFRLTGRYYEAAFLRELFDEPATILYQVWSLLRTIDDTVKPGSSIKMEYVLTQTDHLIVQVVQTLEGAEETEIVRHLLRLRDSLTRQQEGQGLTVEADSARADVINIVNNFFYEKLTALPEIKSYMATMQTAGH